MNADGKPRAHGEGVVERAIDGRLLSRERASASAEDELDASEALLKRDGKDIYKKSATRKNRYAMIFPGHLSALKEGRLGEMREMHTQEPVVYLDFPLGRLKLLGTIVRPKTTRYFTLNAKSKDRMNMEEWFDSVIVFSSWFWIGTAEENPEEKPKALPTELGNLAGEPEVDWDSSVAANKAKPTGTPSFGAVADKKKEKSEHDDADADESGRRPRRQAANLARKKMYADYSDIDDDDDNSGGDDDDGNVASPVIVRGKLESFAPAAPAASPKPSAPMRQSITASARPSVTAAAPSRSKPAAPPAKRARKEDPIVIDSDSDDDDTIEEDSDGSDDDDDLELDDESEDEDEDDEDDSDY